MYYGERFNGYSHLAGTFLAAGGAAALVRIAASSGGAARIVGVSVYGAALVLLYLVSTIYHSIRGRAKDVFRKLDHAAIYLMIAGSYTPFTLVTLGGAWGWALFGIIWGLAAVGIVQELWIARGPRVLSLAIYVLMGWLAVVALVPLFRALSWNGMAWLVGGGLLYTVGIVFYAYDERFRHWHGIWHLFVMAGSAAHFTAVLLFVA
ncbi:MAG TPA: hemolysin III family protein [Usitatibacter sp.]|jgi:hemolysin III|nr:hemolysin III family protein [Usitatibacter sp.]